MMKKIAFYFISFLAIVLVFTSLALIDNGIKMTTNAMITMCFAFFVVFFFMFLIDVLKMRSLKKQVDFLESCFENDCLVDIDEYSDIFNPLILRNQQLKQLMANQERFSTIWVHDIKLPLATLQLFISNNKNELTKQQHLALSQLSIEFEDKITQRLQIDKVYQLDKDFLVEVVDLQKEMKLVIKKLSPLFILKNISIDLDLEPTNKEILTDRRIIEYAFTQILSNALNYSNDSTNILVVGKVSNNNYVLTITDHGIGIATTDINRIFEFGFTGSNGRSRRIYASSGVGLYIIKQQFNHLNHDIKVESQINQYTSVILNFKLT